jgi:hypothetical protein
MVTEHERGRKGAGETHSNAREGIAKESISRRAFLSLGTAAAIAVASTAASGALSGCSSPSETSSANIAGKDRRFDLLIKGGNVYEVGESIDLGIKDGLIVEKGSLSETDAVQVIDAAGKLVSPSFVDTHTHLDKAFQMEDEGYREKARELAAEFMADPTQVDFGFPVAGPSEQYLMSRLKEGKDEDEIKDIIKTRLRRALDMAIVNETASIKTNNTWGPLGNTD